MSVGLLYGDPALVTSGEVPRDAAITWTGADGSTWDLGEPEGVYLLAGTRGLAGRPPRQRWATESPASDGSRHRGGRDQERLAFWPLVVADARGGQAVLDLSARFQASLDYDTPGIWTFTQPNGRSRSLALRLSDDDDPIVQQMPTLSGRMRYGFYLVGNDPYWLDDTPVRRPFLIGGSGSDFIPEDGAPPFNIVQGSLVEGAQITNPSDVIGWPRYIIEGTGIGAQDVTVGIGDQLIGAPDVPAGSRMVIDTKAQTTTLNGVRVRGVLSPHDFAPIPPRSTVQLALSATGAGRITVEFTPRWRTAW